MTQLPSPFRLRIDLITQLVLALLAAFTFVLGLAPVWWLSAALLLIGWQIGSAGELRWHYRLSTRDRILYTQIICLVLVPFLLPIYGILSWLPALTVAGVHLLLSNREYVVIRRRNQSFWDL